MERGSSSMAVGFETLWLAASTFVFFFLVHLRNILKIKTASFLRFIFLFLLFHTFFFLPIIFLNRSGHKCSQGVFYTSINFLFCENMLRNYKEGNTFLLAYSNLKANDEWLTGRTRLPKQGK